MAESIEEVRGMVTLVGLLSDSAGEYSGIIYALGLVGEVGECEESAELVLDVLRPSFLRSSTSGMVLPPWNGLDIRREFGWI